MNASKKYQYHPLTKETLVHSLKLGIQLILKHPAIIIAMVIIPIFQLIPFLTHIIIIYMLSKSKWIDDDFSENWSTLKSSSIFFATLSVIISLCLFTYAYINIGDAAPLVTEIQEETDTLDLIGSSFLFIISVFVSAGAIYYMILDGGAGELYEKYNGVNSSLVILKDYKMIAFTAIVSIFITGVMRYIDTDSIQMIFLTIIGYSLSYYLLVFIVLAHIYTPEPPKVKVTKLATDLA